MILKMDIIPYFLTFLLFFFLFLTFLKIQKYQNTSSKKIAFIEIEIEKERKKELQLNTVSKKISDFEKNTNQQFLKINVAILNFDFTLQEIL
jgi:hypothetical protein